MTDSNTNVSGIYKITNTVNGKFYIGSAVNINARWRTHKYHFRRNTHHNYHLQNSWNKYGEACFQLSVVEVCFLFALIFREQYYIDTLKPEYNLDPKAGSRLGHKESAETCLKKSVASKGRKRTPEQIAALSAALKGKKKSHEHIANIVAARKAGKGYAHSDETRKKIGLKSGLKPRVGFKHSEETRLRMKILHTGAKRSEETKRKMSESHKGKIKTPEHIANHSASLRNWWRKKKEKESDNTK